MQKSAALVLVQYCACFDSLMWTGARRHVMGQVKMASVTLMRGGATGVKGARARGADAARRVLLLAALVLMASPAAALDRDDPLDSDGDGLTDWEEINMYGTDPNNKDTDGDGLSDFEEVKVYRTNPLLRDTDKDGIDDLDELMKTNTNPLLHDSDNDGYGGKSRSFLAWTAALIWRVHMNLCALFKVFPLTLI